MFLLRRTATRAISAPSKSPFTKPRSITTYTPIALKSRQQQWTSFPFQRRLLSDEASKAPENEQAEEAAKAADSSESPESFSQTAAEAPVDESLSPASADQQDQPTIASAIASVNETVQEKAADAVESAATATESVQEKASDAAAALGAAAGVASPNNTERKPWAQSAASPNTILYVGNLFFEVGDDQLKEIFKRFGPVVKTSIVYDNRGLSRGFGYVEFEKQADATAAIDNLHGQIFEGRNMNVQYHQPRQNANRRPNLNASTNNPSKTLFIGNMSFEMSDKDLNDLFRDIRNVMDVRVAIDRRTGQPRGFAHADFIDIASAERAKTQLENKTIYGRTLRVDYSTSASKDPRTRGQNMQ